jgi:hypothetical protein
VIGLAIEPIFGAYTAPTGWLPGRSSLKRDTGKENIDLAIGEWDNTHWTRRPFKVSGGLTLELCPGRLAEFVDLFSFRNAPNLKSATLLEQQGTGFVKAHTGVTVATCTIRCDVGGDLRAELDCRAQNSGPGAPAAPNFLGVPDPYVFEELVITRDEAEIEYCRGIEISIDHTLRDDKFGSDGTFMVRGIPSRRRRLEIRPQFDFEDPWWYTADNAGTEFALDLTWTRAGVTFGLNFPRCIVRLADPEQPEIESETMLSPTILPLRVVGAEAAMAMSVG